MILWFETSGWHTICVNNNVCVKMSVAWSIVRSIRCWIGMSCFRWFWGGFVWAFRVKGLVNPKCVCVCVFWEVYLEVLKKKFKVEFFSFSLISLKVPHYLNQVGCIVQESATNISLWTLKCWNVIFILCYKSYHQKKVIIFVIFPPYDNAHGVNQSKHNSFAFDKL